MDKKRKNDFTRLLRAARIYRVLPTLMVILVPATFVGHLSWQIFIMMLIGILIYSASGIYNAIRDNDYSINYGSKKIIYILLIISLILSLTNRIIFLTTIIAIILGIIYNTYSRRIILADSSILAVTHFALPCFASSILIGLNYNFAFILSGYLFLVFWFLMPIKNLKGIDDDKKRKYKTLATTLKNGKLITLILFCISFFLMFIAYFLFRLNKIYPFILIIILMLYILVIIKILSKKEIAALKYVRGIILLFLFGIILGVSNNIIVIFFSSLLIIIYLLILFKDKLKGGKK